MGSDIRLERASDDILPRAISDLLLRDSYLDSREGLPSRLRGWPERCD